MPPLCRGGSDGAKQNAEKEVSSKLRPIGPSRLNSFLPTWLCMQDDDGIFFGQGKMGFDKGLGCF